MVNKRETERVQVLRGRLARGLAQRQTNMEEWSENAKFYLDGTGDERLIGEHDHEIVLNKVFSSLRAQLPSLMFSRPKWEVSSRRNQVDGDVQGAVDLAQAREHILNYWWKELNVQFHVRLAIIASKIAFGAMKVGYTADFEDNPHAGVLKVDDEGRFTIGANGLPELESGDYLRDDDGDPVIDPESGIPLLQPGELLCNEHFFIKFMHWSRFIFDPEGENDFNDHAWVAEEWCRPTNDIKNDKLLNANRKLVGPTEFVGVDSNGDMLGVDPQAQSEPNQGSAVKADEERTRGYTIYDFRKRRIQVIAEAAQAGTHEFLLRDDPLPPEQEHGPYVFLRLNEVPGRWAPIPDITPMKSPQEEINILRSKMATHVARADRKYGYREDSFEDEDALQKLMGGGDMTMVPMDGPEAIWPIPQAPMDNAVYNSGLDMDKAFDEVAGQSAETRGVAKSETATQASILESRGQLRESDQRELIHDFVVGVGRKLDQTLRANMTQDIWVAAGDATLPYPYPGGENGMLVTPADLQMEADIDIQVGSMLPKTNAVARQQFAQVFELLAKAPILLQVPELLQRVFELFEIADTGLSKAIAATAQQQAEAQQQAKTGGGGGGLPQQLNGGEGSPVGGVPTGGMN